jgi:hypothetical protein
MKSELRSSKSGIGMNKIFCDIQNVEADTRIAASRLSHIRGTDSLRRKYAACADSLQSNAVTMPSPVAAAKLANKQKFGRIDIVGHTGRFGTDIESNEVSFAPAPNHGGQDKQVWVWSFADALMRATGFEIEHMDALDLGYRLWPSQGHRSPAEVVSDRWVMPDDEGS